MDIKPPWYLYDYLIIATNWEKKNRQERYLNVCVIFFKLSYNSLNNTSY